MQGEGKVYREVCVLGGWGQGQKEGVEEREATSNNKVIKFTT